MKAVLVITVALIISAAALVSAAFPAHIGVRKSTAELATQSQRANFAKDVVGALADMSLAAGTGGAGTRDEIIKNKGAVDCNDVAEVNDTFTNVHLECELETTQKAIIESANVRSYNALKVRGVVMGSNEGASGETQGARTVVFFAIVTIVAVVCAGLASWFVRRRSLDKHRSISFADLTSLEDELVQQQQLEKKGSKSENLLPTGSGGSKNSMKGNSNNSNNMMSAPHLLASPPKSGGGGRAGGNMASGNSNYSGGGGAGSNSNFRQQQQQQPSPSGAYSTQPGRSSSQYSQQPPQSSRGSNRGGGGSRRY